MTKIQGPHTPPLSPANLERRSREPEPVKTEREPKVHQASAQSQGAIKQRIQYWFAQAGVEPKSYRPGQKPNAGVNRRQSVKERRKLENLEAILGQALEFNPSQVSDQQLDPDWFFSFIEIAENIYTPAMQELWSKILAVEVSQPGSFSLRSLLTLKQLTHKDAEVFRRASRLACRRAGDYSPRIIYGYYQRPGMFNLFSLQRGHPLNLAQFGLPYPDLLLLMDLGLLYRSEIESGELELHKSSEWRYGSHQLRLQPKRKGLVLNYYKFTATGTELSRLVPHAPYQAYFDALKQHLSPVFSLD
ncbi:hypothetical protein HMF8227_02028 [Saliniradius amylolyticus]|uniref:TIGR03899 family protein n=1 Tax=Saliniradius amylolyticus TaxID=2183582 RepID=A0A2S2E4D3_9ALTE|nr:TIGR03899 family protein [Saliniradius amylolyticus]AWL12493.1 hypothetical protein HMF8227_02028 [Saliniradius amylolyticus]